MYLRCFGEEDTTRRSPSEPKAMFEGPKPVTNLQMEIRRAVVVAAVLLAASVLGTSSIILFARSLIGPLQEWHRTLLRPRSSPLPKSSPLRSER